MRRPPFYLVLAAIVGLLLAACASPSGGEPGASAGGGEPSTAAESQDGGGGGGGDGGGGGGGGGGGLDSELGDGAWTGGTAQVDLSGDASGGFEAPLFSATSLTDGTTTTLTFTGDGGLIGIAIDAETFSVSVTTAEVVAGGGTTTNCSVSYTSTSSNNLSGDFSCPDSPAFTSTGTSGGTVDIEGSFTATR
jgi:hypothetical protein